MAPAASLDPHCGRWCCWVVLLDPCSTPAAGGIACYPARFTGQETEARAVGEVPAKASGPG